MQNLSPCFRDRPAFPALLRRCATRLLLGLAAVAGPARAESFQQGDYHFEHGPRPAFAVVHEPAARWDAGSDGAEGGRWRNWLVDDQVDLRGGTRVHYADRVYEAGSAELLSDAGKYSIQFNPAYQTLAIHQVAVFRDGRWFDRFDPKQVTLARRETEIDQDVTTGEITAIIIVPDVRLSDRVRISYSLAGQHPLIGPYTHQDFSFAWTDPMLDIAVRVLSSAEEPLAIFRDPEVPEFGEKREGDTRIYEAHAHAVAGRRMEDGVPSWLFQLPHAIVTRSHAWGDIARWANTLYPTPAALPGDLEARIAEWKRLADPRARLAAAVTAVQEEVRYLSVALGDSAFKPEEPALTWSRRFGDCKDKSRLLVAVLGELGIAAEPALVSTQLGPRLPDLPPSAGWFDHVIVRITLDDGVHWIDPTRSYQRGDPGSYGVGSFGNVLVIADDSTAPEAMAPPDAAGWQVKSTSHYAPDATLGGIALTVSTEYRGSAAEAIRRQFATSRRDRVGSHYADYYRKLYGNLEPVGEIGVHDDEHGNLVTVDEHYRLAEPWARNAPGARSLDVYSEQIERELELPATVQRRMPLVLAHPTHVVEVVEIELPPGWKTVQRAGKDAVHAPSFDFTSTSEQDGAVFRIRHEYTSRQRVVAAADLDETLKARRDAKAALSRRLSLASTETRGKSEREERLNDLMRTLMNEPGHADAAKPH